MAQVTPFCGVRYNSNRIGSIAQVVAPPYDVISPAEQDGYYRRHPYNIIRLILGQHFEGDNDDNNVHTRAGAHFRQWLADDILVKDQQPCFYLTSVSFNVEGKTISRFGIIGKVRLEPFEKGIILPHERTYSKVKSERLRLMKACHANFSCIFGLYSDRSGLRNDLLTIARNVAPDIDFIDDRDLRHKVWCVSDQNAVERIAGAFQDERIYIADGHHRYETALNYLEWVKTQTAGFDETHPANFIMMSLSSLEDPGMVVLPAHRLLKNIPSETVLAMLDRAHAYFDIHTIDIQNASGDAMASFKTMMQANADKSAIGVLARNPKILDVLIVKDGVMDRLFAEEFPEPLRVLDVTVLTNLILMKLLDFSQTEMDDVSKVSYRTSIDDAADAVQSGDADLAFILNPTKIEQVQRIAEHNLIMPRKSTYFYPKVVSGLVLNSLRD